MIRQIRIFALVCVVLLSSAAIAPIAVAQADEPTDENQPEPDSVVAMIDNQTAVADYDWDGERLVLEIQAERMTTVNVVEAIPFESDGATNIAIESVRVRPGTTEIEISPQHHPAVIVSTNAGINDGNAAFINAESSRSYPDIPFGMSVILVGLAAAGGAGATVKFVQRGRNNNDKETRRLR